MINLILIFPNVFKRMHVGPVRLFQRLTPVIKYIESLVTHKAKVYKTEACNSPFIEALKLSLLLIPCCQHIGLNPCASLA